MRNKISATDVVGITLSNTQSGEEKEVIVGGGKIVQIIRTNREVARMARQRRINEAT